MPLSRSSLAQTLLVERRRRLPGDRSARRLAGRPPGPRRAAESGDKRTPSTPPSPREAAGDPVGTVSRWRSRRAMASAFIDPERALADLDGRARGWRAGLAFVSGLDAPRCTPPRAGRALQIRRHRGRRGRREGEKARPPPPPPPPPSAPPLTEEQIFSQKTVAQLNAERPLADVLFDLDQATLREDGRAAASRNADWLKRWPSTQVTSKATPIRAAARNTTWRSAPAGLGGEGLHW